MAEPATAIIVIQLWHWRPLHVCNRLHDQLGNSIPTLHVVITGRIMVDHDDLQLAAVRRIDDAGRVHQRNAVFQCKSTPWHHHAHVANGYRHCNTRWNEDSPTIR